MNRAREVEVNKASIIIMQTIRKTTSVPFAFASVPFAFAYIEPDTAHELKYLEAIRDVFGRKPKS